jgi:hypothetical protein
VFDWTGTKIASSSLKIRIIKMLTKPVCLTAA